MFNATIITNYATTGPLPSYIDPVTNLNNNNVPKSILTGSTNGTLVVDGVAEQTEILTVDDAPPGNLQNAYFLISSPSRDYYVWYNVAGGGTDPSIPGRIGLQVNIPSGDLAANIAVATGIIIDAQADFSVTLPASNPFIVKNTTEGIVLNPPEDGATPTGFTIKTPPGLVLVTSTNNEFGNAPDTADVNAVGAGKLASLTKTADGTPTTGEINTIDASDATAIGLDGTYFFISSPSVDYYVWFNLDGTSVDPAPALRTRIEVAITSTDSDVGIAKKLAAAFNATLGNNAELVFTAVGPNTSGVGQGQLNVGDRILVKDEPADKLQYNGLYIVQTVGSGTVPWQLIRDFDNINLKQGDTFYVESGVQNAGILAILSNNIIMPGESGSPANFTIIMGSGAVDFNSIAPVSASDMCGDLIVRTDSSGAGGAGDTWTALPVGSSGQFLSVTGTGLQCIGWTTLDVDTLLGGILTPLEGEMLVVDSSLNVVKLPAPSGNGQILQTGISPPPLAPNTWKNIQWSPFRLSNFLPGVTTGNVIAFNGVSGNWEILSIGTNGQVLTVDNTQTLGLKWESGTASAAGYDNNVQFKIGAGFASDDDYEYDPITDRLSIPEGGKYTVKTGGAGPSNIRTLLYTPGSFGATTGTNVAVGGDISPLLNFTNTLVFGVGSAPLLDNGDSSIIIGNLSATNLTDGNDNLVIGHGSFATTLSERNVAIGNGTLATFIGAAGTLTGGQNTAVGFGALAMTAFGTRNTAVGFQSLGNITLGDNCAFGYRAAYNSGASTFMSAFGFEALNNNTNGNNSSAFGYRAMGVSGSAAIGNQCAFGYRALGNLNGGTSNNAFGADALLSNTLGGSNNAFGQSALLFNLVGSRNSAFGHQTLLGSTGSDNTGVGNIALTAATSSRNTSVGSESLSSLIGGAENNAFGYRAATNITASGSVCAFGTRALQLSTGGNNNNAFGNDAMRNSGINSNNNAFGYQSLENVSGSFNCGFGEQTLRSGSSQSCAFGYQAASSASLTAIRVHAFGYQALASNQGGTNNNAFGYQSLTANTSGINNTGFGNSTLSAITTTSNNTAFGYQALTASTGTRNSAFGSGSITGAGFSERNSAFGYLSLAGLTTGTDNCAFGDSALATLGTGMNNSVFGSGAGTAITTGSHNVLVGKDAGLLMTTQSQNVGVGYRSLVNAVGGLTPNNTALGYNSGANLTTGTQCTYIGSLAGGLSGVSTASNNTGLGFQSLGQVTTGADNTAGGSLALYTCTTGANNTAFGSNALSALSTNNRCTAIGTNALLLCTASDTTAVGYNAGAAITTGITNSLFGSFAGDAISTGDRNTGLGYSTLGLMTTNSDCTAVGYSALSLATGGTNTAVGASAGNSVSTGTGNSLVGYNVATALTTGANNVVAGNATTGATLGTGSGNVIIGVGADVDTSARSDCVVLGNGAVITSATHALALGSMITDTSAPTNGAAGAVPAQPATYLRINVNGVIYKIALWEDTP